MDKKQLRTLASKKIRDLNIEGLSRPSSGRLKPLFFMCLAALTIMLVVGIFNRDGFLEVFESEKDLAALRASIPRLREENQALAREINSLKNDPRYMEKIAREDLGLAMPDETIFVFPDED